jgi:type IV secretory pathway TraG/TraD family ATPase VirD4
LSGVDKYGTIILAFAVMLGSIPLIIQSAHSHRLRRVFNFRKELKKMRAKKPAKVKQPPLDSTLIGYTGRKPIYIANDAKHVFVCGTTGSGKTVALSNFIKNAVDKEYPALIIDGKGDTAQGSILDILQNLKGNRKLYVINLNNPKQSDKYNPFKGSSPTMAKDMLINLTDWTEEHYKLNAERYIQRALQLLEIGKISLSFQRIIKILNQENFLTFSRQLLEKRLIDKEQHIENAQIAETSGKISQNSVARYSTILESEVGTIFSGNGIDIAEALEEKAIILFILNPLLYPELSSAFGRLLLIDAKKAIGRLFQFDIKRTFFILDEINVYASTALTDLINKSRSARVTCMLATQSLSDLDFACGDAYKEQIIENCNNYIVMRQNSGVNAEHWANILGTRSTMEVTHQLQQRGLDTHETGYGSARRVREYIYHPDEIKALKTGQAFFLSRDMGYDSFIKVNKPF